MFSFKSAKIFFFFAVMLLVAKPFLGFSMFSRLHPPAEENIFVKAFNKRKQEYAEDSNYDVIAIQKKLADPARHFLLHFSVLLNILFPFFSIVADISNRFFKDLQLNLLPRKRTYLFNSKLII